jgi:hypothetical protein
MICRRINNEELRSLVVRPAAHDGYLYSPLLAVFTAALAGARAPT